MSTHNIGFYEDSTKIIFELSSNMHLISSADVVGTNLNHPNTIFIFCLSILSHALIMRQVKEEWVKLGIGETPGK